MTFTCNGKTYSAESIDEAYYKALTDQGVEAIGACVECVERTNILCGVCLDAYREAFPTFTDEDFLNYEILLKKAWLEFPTETVTEYDWDGEYTVTRLCDEGMEYIHNNSALSRYMDAIGFRW